MRAAITGATGLVGGNLAIALLADGHEVVATRRATSRTGHLDAFDIAWVEATLEDRAALERAFSGCEVVFHCAAEVSFHRRPTPRMIAVNVDGTRNVLAAAAAVGASRLVHCSSAAAVGISTDGRPVDEEHTWNFAELGMDDAYAITKRQSEEIVLAAAAEGGEIDAVVVNPTYMLGPYDAKPSSGGLILQAARGATIGYTDGYNNFVDVRDVCRGMIAAAERGRRGERYILGGDNLGYREIFTRIAAAAGGPKPRFRIPRPLAMAAGRMADGVTAVLNRDPKFGSVAVLYAYCRGYQFTSAKAERELGYAPGPIDRAIADAVAWFRGRGMLR